MQTIKAYFENQEARILAYVVGFGNIGYNQGVAVYSTPVSLYSGTNNPIKIQCLNSDQKRINVSNVTVQLGVFQPGTQNELIVKTATNVDSANGVIETILTSSDLAPLDFGQYEIALVAVDEFNNAYPVYINDYYGSRLPTSLSKGPVLAYPDPIPVVWTDQSGIGVCSDAINLTTRPMNSTTATACMHLNSYTGNAIFSGTLVSSPTNTDWGNVSSTYYSNVSGLVFQNVEGSFAWIRIILDSIDPNGYGNISPSNIANYIMGGNIRI